ncbi:Putative single-stranded DNA binding protein [Arachis hypogaea]|nr:Putative single-stranded DNA binding protein [Arachis hypogaea]
MLRYRLQVIVTDGSGCMKLLLWNKEAEQMVQKVAEKIKELSISLIDGSLKYFASVLYVFWNDNKIIMCM